MDGPPRKRVLLVEDDLDLLRIYQIRLRRENFMIDIAKNGEECFQALSEYKPDFILLDLMMPVMDGLQVLEKIKSNPETKDIPMIVLSNRSDKETMNRAMSLGALDFLVKINSPPNVVIDKIKETLEKKEGAAAPSHYRIAVKESVYDAVRLAQDFKLPPLFRCPHCNGEMTLELVPEYTHEEPWFIGHFVCPKCST